MIVTFAWLFAATPVSAQAEEHASADSSFVHSPPAEPAEPVEPTPAVDTGELEAVSEPAEANGPLSLGVLDSPTSPLPTTLPEPAYRRPARRPYLRLLAAETLFLAGGATWYWTDREFNAGDWDYSSWRRRLSIEAFRYDNNEFSTNWVFHPLAGSAFHGFARGNGFGVGASIGVSFLTSTVWESLIEFREKFSINDLIATPGAGAPMGEFFHHVGSYLYHVHGGRSRGFGHRLMAWTFGLPTTMHRRMDRVPSMPELAPLFDTHFRLAYGVESWQVRGHGPILINALSLEADIGDHTSIGSLEEGFRYFHDGNIVTFRLRTELLRDRPGIDMLSDVVVFGGIRRIGDGVRVPLRETAIGAEIGFIYQRREWDAFHDNYSILELLGLSVDHRMVDGPLTLRARLRAAPTFAAMNAPGFRQWVAENPGVQGKTILSNWDYYNAYGASVRIEGVAAYGPLETGARIAFGYANSIEGLDRKQEEVVIDQDCREHRITWDAYARVRPLTHRGLMIGFEARGLRSHSRIDSIRTERAFWALGMSIGGER